MAQGVPREAVDERSAPRRAGRLVVLSIAVGALAVGAYLFLRPATATLRIDLEAPFDVSIDGAERGTTPLVAIVTSGKHDVRIHAPGFVDRRVEITAEPGREVVVAAAPRIADPDDPEAISRLATGLGDSFASWELPGIYRSSGPEGMEMLLPRGDVRLEDLATYSTVMNDESTDGRGTIEFRRGKDLLHSRPFEAKVMLPEVHPFPDEVRKALKPGDVVTWGFYAAGPKPRQRPATATFKVVDVDLTKKLWDLGIRLADQPVALMPVFRAKLLMGRRLFTAAVAEASTLTAKDSKALRGWVVVLQSLSALDLADSWLGAEARTKIDRIDEALKEKVLPRRR